MDYESEVKAIKKELEKIKSMISAHDDDGQFLCVLDKDWQDINVRLEETKRQQDIIIQQNRDSQITQEAFQKSQDRMFRLIVDLNKRIEDFEQKVDYELKKGRKRMDKIDDYMNQKNITNGFRDKAVEKIEKDVEDKASKQELTEAEATLESKIDLLVKNSADQLAAQKEFNAMFWKILTIFFVVVSAIVGILGLLLRG
jgi:hypothetical protein